MWLPRTLSIITIGGTARTSPSRARQREREERQRRLEEEENREVVPPAHLAVLAEEERRMAVAVVLRHDAETGDEERRRDFDVRVEPECFRLHRLRDEDRRDSVRVVRRVLQRVVLEAVSAPDDDERDEE
jgi:hypothetical protein